LHNPAGKPGRCFNSTNFGLAPFKITAKLSDMNYEIISINHNKQVVHVNMLKKAYDPEIWKPKQEPEAPKKRINRDSQNQKTKTKKIYELVPFLY